MIATPEIVGIKPALPGFLKRSPWLNDPISATRLAAVRIATGAVFLFDILFLYWPYRNDYLGPNSLGAPGVFADRFTQPTWHWSLFQVIPTDMSPDYVLAVWALASAMLMLGIFPRTAAFVAWAITLSIRHCNPYINNSGDLVRQFLLFILMLSPCGATWTVFRPTSKRPVLIYPWPVCLIIIQLCWIYLMNGVYKLLGPEWRDGSVMFWVMGSASWARWCNFVPYWAAVLMSWTVLIWELGFPLFLMIPWARTAAIWMGVIFHVGSGLQLELGPFPLYALCAYVVFVPWERMPHWWRQWKRSP